MSRKLRPADGLCLRDLNFTVSYLRLARDRAQRADCPRLTAKIRAALRSADGARRHVERRLLRSVATDAR